MEIIFNRVHTIKDLIISAVVLAGGAGCCLVNVPLGILLIGAGVLMLGLYKAGYKRKGEDVVLVKKALDVAHSCRDSLVAYLGGKDVEPQVDTQSPGGIIRIEAYYNASAQVAYVQLFDFSDYSYQPATEIVELRGERASKLISKLL